MGKKYSIQKRECRGKHQPASHCCIRSCAAGVKRQSSSTVCRLPATLNSRWRTLDSSWNTRRRDSVIRFPRPRQVEILLPSGTFKWGFPRATSSNIRREYQRTTGKNWSGGSVFCAVRFRPDVCWRLVECLDKKKKFRINQSINQSINQKQSVEQVNQATGGEQPNSARK